MEPKTLESITSAVAPVVMVSAAGLLLLGIQTKNLHLADRLRGLTAEYRTLAGDARGQERRRQIRDQLPLFTRRIRLTQRSLELLYVAMVCFVMTSLVLASGSWLGGAVVPVLAALLFLGGVSVLLVALLVEFLEMRAGLLTIGVEIEGTMKAAGHGE
jgi:hypothetical protein